MFNGMRNPPPLLDRFVDVGEVDGDRQIALNMSDHADGRTAVDRLLLAIGGERIELGRRAKGRDRNTNSRSNGQKMIFHGCLETSGRDGGWMGRV